MATDLPKTYRLSLLAFDQPSRLWGAAQELLAQGVDAAQFCILGLPTAMGSLVLPQSLLDTSRAQLAQLLSGDTKSIHLEDGTRLSARCGAAMATLIGVSSVTAGPFYWMQREFSEKLAAHAERGALILIVGANTAHQQVAVSRVLLQYGPHNLQTHEFTERMSPTSSAVGAQLRSDR